MSVVKIACIQTNSTPEPDENIASVSDLIREASASGAQIITTPEVVGMLEPNRASALSKAEPEDCLLYTSPSPRDQRGSRMPSYA